MRSKRVTAVLTALAGFLMVAGCGRPQASPQNLHLIASLRTAISARNAEWLEQNAALIEQRREAGEMADAEYRTFQTILELARDGKWEAAEQETITFQKAQRPTAEQIDQVKQRAVSREHR